MTGTQPQSAAGRLAAVLAAVDAANAEDPSIIAVGGERSPAALVYGRRMSEVLAAYVPEASEPLRIAARAQHIERWLIPRGSYPEGRIGYLTWRKDLQKHHARRTAAIMEAADYDAEAIARVGALLRKERLKQDDEVQALENVVCLVFLEFEAPDFIAKHDDAKVRDILAKTAKKMSPRGLAAAARLTLEPRLSRLLSEALSELDGDGKEI
ncbi:MAG: DUF4202 domain-containing protein [Hyphomicrobiales bacterium]